MFSAQILSIISFCISWFWFMPFFMSLIAMILLQVAWCRRVNSVMIWSSAWISFSAGVNSFYYFARIMNEDDSSYYETCESDNVAKILYYNFTVGCAPLKGLSLTCGGLSIIVTSILFIFMGSGRFERCLEDHSSPITEEENHGSVHSEMEDHSNEDSGGGGGGGNY